MKQKAAILLTLIMLILCVVPAGAGGWVVISLDEIPGPATAGEPLIISFMLLQHGQTPSDWAMPEVHLTSAEGQTIILATTSTDTVGQYKAEVIFPTAGQWQWKIVATPFLQELELPEQNVASGLSAPAIQMQPLAGYTVAFRWVALAVLLLAALGIGVEQRRRATGPVARSAAD